MPSRPSDPIPAVAHGGSGTGASAADGTRIALCGALAAQIAGRAVTGELPGRQGRVLFAYLVLNRDRPVTRGELLDVLWPSNPPADPDAVLSSVLARLRRALGEGVVEGRTTLQLRLDERARVDVEEAPDLTEEAEQALAAGDARRALAAAEAGMAIVERPLLPDLQAPWVDEQRRELGDLGVRLRESLARAHVGVGELSAAEQAARALVDRHPYHESGYALLMEIQAQRGNVAQAMQTFARLRAFLMDELGTTPSAAVTALNERLLRHGRLEEAVPAPTAPAAPVAGAARIPLPFIGGPAGTAAFVGREECLQRLRSSWAQIEAQGPPRLVLLVGEAGVGKTRLAARFAEEVHPGGATVLYGRSEEESIIPYQPFVEALRQYLAHEEWGGDDVVAAELGRLLPEARRHAAEAVSAAPAEPEMQRFRLFEAVAMVLAGAARSRPTLLVVDDLHWADKPTLLMLRHLMRHADTARLMVVATVRDVEAGLDHPLGRVLADLRREGRLDRLALGGLDDDEAEALIASRLTMPATADFARRLRARTEGNPFFIEEALRSLAESDALDAGEPLSERTVERLGVPESVKELILGRLSHLSPAAVEAVTAGSVAGRDFGLDLLRAVLDVPSDHALAALEEAIGSGLVLESPVTERIDLFSFSHVLVREAIYQQLSASRRVRLHARVADVLEAEHETRPARVHPAELAHHCFLARHVTGPERAIRAEVHAGEAASSSLAYEEAAAHYRRALEVFDSSGEGPEAERCDILLALGRVQWQAGDAGARATYVDAVKSARVRREEPHAPVQLARAALGLGERYWEANVADFRYRGLLEEAVGSLGDGDSTLRARLLARLAENLHFAKDQERAEALSREAVEMARRLGDADVLVATLMGRHVALLHVEHLDERLRLISEVLRLSGGHRELSAEGHHWRLFDLFELGDLVTAREEQAALDTLADELRQPLFQHVAVSWRSVWAQLAGDVETAERLAQESFEFGSRAQATDAQSVRIGKLYPLRRQQGRLAELLEPIDSLAEGTAALSIWRTARALALVEAGDAATGRSAYEHFAGQAFDNVPQDFFWHASMALLAETAVALGDAARAAVLYDRLRPYGSRVIQVSFTCCFGSAERYLGLLAAATGRLAEAEAHYTAAIERNTALQAPLLTAEAQCDYGRLLVARDEPGDRARAHDLGAQALAAARRAGMEGLATRSAALQA